MAHLWISSVDNGLTAVPLSGKATPISNHLPAPPSEAEAACGDACIELATVRGQDQWLLHFDEGHGSLRVNGFSQELGLFVLSDGDEIRIGDYPPLVFSTEKCPVVAPLPASDAATQCVRCKTEIDAGTPAVRCPGCGLWYHQEESLPCWTYAPHCAICGAETGLDTGYQRIPEAL